MVVVAAVLARLVARPFIAERVAAAGVGEAWVGAAAGAVDGATAGAVVGAIAGAVDGAAVVTAGAGAGGAADSVGIGTCRDRSLSKAGDSRCSMVTASITCAPVAIFEDVSSRLPSLASDAPVIQSRMAV